jgi:hypothetical protein
MLRLLTDENFNHKIVRGLRMRLPAIDCVVVQKAGLAGFADEKLLEIAAREDRVLITHDVQTMIAHAYDRVVKGLEMPGVIVVPNGFGVGRALNDLELTIECLGKEEIKDQIRYLPLSHRTI